MTAPLLTRREAVVRAGLLAAAAATGTGRLLDLFGPGTAAAATAQANQVASSFASQALASRLHLAVHLPPGYDETRRYPVVYFLHGLPAAPSAYLSFAWVAKAVWASGEALVVIPQASRSQNGDPEYLNWGRGDDWETALAVELPAYVDRTYSTVATRAGRAVVGVSAGGYGATALGLHHPSTFSVIQSWSGYFRPTDPTGATPLQLAAAEEATDDLQNLVPKLRAQFASHPTSLAFYVGRGDPTFVADNVAFHEQLTAAKVPHLFELYAGGHTTTLWQTHAAGWLGLALSKLDRAT